MIKEIVGYDSKKLLGLGFTMEKTDLWKKEIRDAGIAYWDFRKIKKGRFYVSTNNGFMPDNDAKDLDEYKLFRNSDDPKIEFIQEKSISDSLAVRGDEARIADIVKSRRLDLIKQCSSNKDKPGESILYYDIPKLGLEPSVELIDMISADMGGIEVSVLDHGIHHHVDVDSGREFYTYYAVVKAMDKISGSEGLGSAEEIISFDEMNKQGRTFAFTKAIRKAERNAKERLIPVPRKVLVQLVINIMKGVA